MRLRKLTLRNWRNVALASLDFEGRQQFLLGANGQGKTSLLEAAAFFTALRSFRTLDPRLVIAHGQAEAAIAGVLEHERLGETKVIIKLGAESKEVWCDQERIVRLADDVLGELDPERRGRFWEALAPELQVIATGTSLPDDAALGRWQVFRADAGRLTASAGR
jgi:recombinational DNA repair ATPase RecF